MKNLHSKVENQKIMNSEYKKKNKEFAFNSKDRLKKKLYLSSNDFEEILQLIEKTKDKDKNQALQKKGLGFSDKLEVFLFRLENSN